MSSLLDLLGFCAVTFGVYELAGRGWALITAAVCLFLLGLAVDNAHPVRAMRAAATARLIVIRRERALAKERARNAT